MRDKVLVIFHVDEGFDDYMGLHESVAEMLEVDELDVDLIAGDASRFTERTAAMFTVYDPWYLAPEDSLLEQVISFCVDMDAFVDDTISIGVLDAAIFEEE